MSKKKPSDFFSAEIKMKNIVVSKLYGSYLSFIEFDGVRYWDIRENLNMRDIEVPKQPLSSALYRDDRLYLADGQIDLAQKAKEKLENIQRLDRKFREVYQKMHNIH